MTGHSEYANSDGINFTPVSFAKPLPVSVLPNSLLLTVTAAAVSAPGTGWVPGDTATIAGGDYATRAILNITDTKVISAAVVAGGTGGTPGAVTVTGTTGTGTKFQATGTITAGGILSGTLTVTVAGDYTVNPTVIAVEPVTGGGLTGATVIVAMGALTATVNTAGLYSVAPTNPASVASTSGTGTGATFTLTTAANSAAADSVVALQTSTTGSESNVASSASAVTLLVANASRLGYSCFNDSTQVLYLLNSSQTPSSSLYTVQIAAGGYFECPFRYTGIVKGIWASANGNLRMTEYT